MRGRVGALGVGLGLLTGCVPSQDLQLVSNPFGQAADVQPSTSMYAASTDEQLAKQVLCVGTKIVNANKDLNLHPLFPLIASEQPEIFHRGREIFITEGLVKKCATEGQLAALLSSELGKIVAEREAQALPETRQPERRAPVDVPVGNDSGGTFGPADGTHLVELAKFDHDRQPRDVTVPPPSPDILTRRILQQAGYMLDDLDAVRPLLRQSEANGTFRKQLLRGVY